MRAGKTPMNNQLTQSSELIQNTCALMLPVSKLLPRGVDSALNTGDSNDAVTLFTPMLVLMLRGLERLKLPLILEACELEGDGDCE